jgi:putative membrane-bound dehydrogenase-like protein
MANYRRLGTIVCLFLLLGTDLVIGAEPDYASQLPPLALKSPAAAQRDLVVRPGFRVELVAAEPLIASPVALDIDEDGRMYVAEYPEYNEYAAKKPHGKGGVRLLEDTDGDGVYEKSTLFAAELPRACAVACWKGGIYVGSPPDLLYLKDHDGDGKADERRVVLTGFGHDRAGEGMMNSFRWGLDNRFRIAAGGDGGDISRNADPGGRTVSVRGYHLLLDPRSERFELTSGGGQHGMSMDNWGRVYVCGNSDPYRMMLYDSRYLARNPYLQAPAAAVNVAPAGKYTKLYRASPVEPWRALRTRLRSQGLIPGSDEGGTPSGFFTGGTGVTVYRGDAFPAEFRSDVFVGDVANNVVHRARPVPDGLLVQTQDAEPAGREFLASRDNAFRPVQMASGPDGCLWVIDMCRGLIEGAAFLAPPILKHVDVTSGVDHGRIWRIVPDGHATTLTRLGRAPTALLVSLLDHPDGWHRDTAARLLYERQDRSAVTPLRQLSADAKSALGRTHARYALQGMGALDAGDVLAGLDDPDADARIHALRLAEALAAESPPLRARLIAMTADPEATVRYQLAFSLGALPGALPAAALAVLAKRDGADSWVRLALLSSAGQCAGELSSLLAADSSFRTRAHGRIVLTALAAQTDVANAPEGLSLVLRAVEGPLAGDPALARDVVLGLLGRMAPAAQARLTGLGQEAASVRTLITSILADAQTTAANEKRSAAARTAAIRRLRFAARDDVRGLLVDLLAPRQPPEVQKAAIETLARSDDASVATILLQAWTGLSPALRATAAEALFARPAWLGAFLDAVEQGSVGRGDLDPARLDLLKTYPDSAVQKRATALFGQGLPRRQEVVAAYQPALARTGDRDRGKALFKTHCSTCHRLENVGEQVGADLSAIRDRGLDSVLLNILDPNREVKPQYQSYVLVTSSGRILTGMIVAETANGLSLRRPDGGEETVLRLDIDELKSTGLSFMPEGLEKQIDVGAMADLLAYLNSIK